MTTPMPRRPRAGSGRQSGAPTIADVAALAGVSTMTVSRVINAESNVRDSTREAVNAAIDTLSYSPNRAARSLAGASQLCVGLLYWNPSAAYLSEFLVGSLDQAGRVDIQLVVQKCDEVREVLAAAERLVKGNIDGIVVPPPLCDSQELVDFLVAVRVPTVLVATNDAPAALSSIAIDDRAAAREMTAHLIGLGHDRIGFVAGSPNLAASGERLAGYREALAAAGLPADEALVVAGLFTYRSGLDAADELLQRAEPPSAIFASNDDMAAAAVAVAHRRGLDVPGDLTVCGFDDSALATTIWPELTTIHQPIADMARAAVDALAGTLRTRRGTVAEPKRVTLDHVLIRRQSDAAPRRRPTTRRT